MSDNNKPKNKIIDFKMAKKRLKDKQNNTPKSKSNTSSSMNTKGKIGNFIQVALFLGVVFWFMKKCKF